jgi:hypothetical protein
MVYCFGAGASSTMRRGAAGALLMRWRGTVEAPITGAEWRSASSDHSGGGAALGVPGATEESFFGNM